MDGARLGASGALGSDAIIRLLHDTSELEGMLSQLVNSLPSELAQVTEDPQPPLPAAVAD